MKRIFTFLIIGWHFTLSSCSKPASAGVTVFSETIVLQGEVQPLSDSLYLRYPFRVRLQADTLYVLDIHTADYYIHRFAYPSMQHLGSLARYGGAPDEFLDAENIRIDTAGHLWTLDANKSKLVQFGKGGDDQIKRIDLDKRLVRTLDFDRLNDSVFIVPDYTGEHRISLLDAKGDIIKQLFQIPTTSSADQAAPVVLAQAWRSFVSYHADHGILAMATQLGQVLEIYDLQKEKVVQIVGKDAGAPQFKNNGGYAVPTGIMGYSDVYVGKEYIYALFWGNSFDEIKQQGSAHQEGGQFIQVFDLQGNPVRQYQLDRLITGFHIDEVEGMLIGLDVNSNQPIIQYRF